MIRLENEPDVFSLVQCIGENEELETGDDSCIQLDRQLCDLIQAIGENLSRYESGDLKEVNRILEEKNEYIENILSDSEFKILYPELIVRIRQSVSTVFNLSEDSVPVEALRTDYYHGKVLRKVLTALSAFCPEGKEVPTLQHLAMEYSKDLINEERSNRSNNSNTFCFYLLRPSTTVKSAVTLSFELMSHYDSGYHVTYHARLEYGNKIHKGRAWTVRFRDKNAPTPIDMYVAGSTLLSTVNSFFRKMGQKNSGKIAVPIKELTEDRAAQYAQQYFTRKHSE